MKETYKNHVWNKIFAMLLCLVMVITTIPMTAHAEETIPTNTSTKESFYIIKGGTYNIQGGTYSLTDNAVVISTDEDVTLNFTGDINAYSLKTQFIKINGVCNLTINGNGTTFNASAGRMLFIDDDYPATVTVNGGTYNNQDKSYGLFDTQGGKLTLNDVTISSKYGNGIVVQAGEVVVNGGSISGKQNGIDNSGSVTVSNAAIKSTNYGITMEKSDTSCVLSGNTTFETNLAGLYLNEGAMFTIADDFTGTATVKVKDTASMADNAHRQITTDGTDAKFLSQISGGTGSYKVQYEENHLYMYEHVHNWNFTADGNTIKARCTVEVNPCEYHDKDLQMSMSAKEKVTFSGNEYNKDGNDITVDGKDAFTRETGIIPQITYYNAESGARVYRDPYEIGKYLVKLSVENDAGETSITAPFEIEAKSVDCFNVSFDSNEEGNLYIKTGNEITPYIRIKDTDRNTTLTTSSYEITGVTSATEYGTYIIHVKGKKNYTGEFDVVWKIVDADKPVLTLKDEKNQELNEFKENQEFNVARNKPVTYTVAATDKESGIKSVSYLISDKLYTKETIKDVKDGWKTMENGGTVTINPVGNAVLYVRTEDASGRVTYVATDAYTFDTTAPVIAGVESGKSYCVAQTVTITDKNLKEVKVNGQAVTLTNGSYVLEPSDDTYTIEAADFAGNVTTVKEVRIRKEGHSWPDEWTTVREATETTEGKQEMVCKNGCGMKKVRLIPALSEKEDPNAGNLEKDAEVQPDVPLKDVTLGGSKSNLLNLFTEQEREQIKNGSEARIWLEIGTYDESKISETDKAAINRTVEEKIGTATKLTYFDASLFKKVGNVTTSLKELKDSDGNDFAVQIVFTVPEELQNTDTTVERVYQIVRLHEGKVDVIDGTYDEKTGEFSFETDRFSTYAIAYHDTKKNDNGNNGGNNGGNNTGNNNGDNTGNNGGNNTGNNGGNNGGNNTGNNTGNNGGNNTGNTQNQADVNQNQVSLTTAANKTSNAATPDTGDSNVGTKGFVIIMLFGAGLCLVAAKRKKNVKNL